jgi:ssDNA-binding Zn-finger/Zn-ribbon topoisomerase 1
MSGAKTHQCPKCHGDLKQIVSKKNGKHYWVCQSAEEICSSIFSDRDGAPLLLTFGEPDPTCPCPECGQPMRMVRGGKFGDYWSCTAYPACDGTLDLNPHGGPVPDCPDDPDHGPMRLRPGKGGKFWGCRRYPECTATRELDGSQSKRKATESTNE